MLLRSARSDDLAALLALAERAGAGLASLPASEDSLARRLQVVEQSFRGLVDRAEADYMFVLEGAGGELIGCSAMLAAAGLREPWYSFRMGLTVTACRELDIYRQHPTLFLVNDLTGSTALCSFYLEHAWRRSLLGRQLSKARLLFLAEHPADFAERVIVEMRGVSDAEGNSPFWDSLGQHFFRMDFARADHLTGIGQKSFIAEMMPRFPLYSCFLSEAAREAIGRVHPESEAALAMHHEEGMQYQGYIDIFDGGATLEAPAGQIRAVRDSRQLLLATGTPGETAQDYLIYNRNRLDCRMIAARAREAAGTLVVSEQDAARLGLRSASLVRAVPLAPPGEGQAIDPYLQG